MPLVRISLKTPKPRGFAADPQTLGEHLKRARVLKRLTQRQAASQLGVDPSTVLNWEKGLTEPPITVMPRILLFLGYDPFPEPQTLSERMLAKRRQMGWTIREAAEQLGVDEGTWGEWEQNGEVRWERYRLRLGTFLKGL